jgi:hypothetical protein
VEVEGGHSDANDMGGASSSGEQSNRNQRSEYAIENRVC